MAIFRKDHVRKYQDQLDKYYNDLRNIAVGIPPNVNRSHDYNCEADQFQKEFTEIDVDDLEFAISHFKVAVDGLRKIEKLKVKPKHKG